MELAHSLLLNEEALSRIPESKRPVFIFEWLRFLDKVLVAAQKSDIKESQQKLIVQLTNEITACRGPPIRKLLASCLATVFSVGDTSALFEMINKCNDIIKNKDDSPSYLPTKLTAITCIGEMYERLGRMVGRSYEETISLLIKALKSAESQGRCEIMLTLKKVIIGLGSAGSNCYKDVYKAAKNCLTERSLPVRSASAACLCELINECPFMYTVELDNLASLCFRAMDSSNYDVRCDVARLLGHLLATALLEGPKQASVSKNKQLKLDDVLNMLGSGFMRGGSSFLKSSSSGENKSRGGNINREIRVGVTHAYVEFVRKMRAPWLERNVGVLLNHLSTLVTNPRNATFHVDAVYARKCVNFILRSLLGSMLAEKAQVAAAKELCLAVIRQMNSLEVSADGAKQTSSAPSSDTSQSHHTLICALQELGCLIQALGTSSVSLVSEPSAGVIEPVVSVLIHPSPSARLAAAWCLRSIAVALPSQMTILIDRLDEKLQRCMSRMQHLKSSTEAISGYSFALAALLGGVRETTLGIPHAKGKQIFSIGEELLRTATQNSRLSLQRTQSGWLLLGALMALGPSVVKVHLPRMLLLWRNAFPRSTKELESEKLRGDAFTWQVTLEGRAGALAAMHSFIYFCPELVTEEVTRRLLPPLECALSMTVHIASIVKAYGTHLKASAATVRLRLYDVLSLLPPEFYETSFNSLLRELVAEFTLTDNPANTTTSRLRSLCHADDSIILGSWLQETDHKAIEDQLQPNSASGSGALEHDPTHLYMPCQNGDHVPGPLPLGVAVIDSSVRLYGLIFPRVAHKHRFQMLEHFAECIRQAKSTRQQAVQINIFTAVLCALKCLAETKTGFGNAEVRKAAVDLVLGALGSTNPILRCAAGEAMGRMVQVVGENKFLAEMAQFSFDRLKTARDVVTRTGHSLALGCLHRYVGGMGAGQHLNTSISILLALAQDPSSPMVQVWALHALALIADSGGPMFRTFVEPSLSLVLQLLLSVPPSNVDVHQCLGKCLAALITTIGPELHGNSSGPIATARLYCLVCCAIMQDHADSIVQSEAISCLQQLHLFAPRHVNLTTLVPHLCETMSSKHLILRRAVVSCLRQLVQREAREVSDHANQLRTEANSKIQQGRFQRSNVKVSEIDPCRVAEVGLEAALFALMDKDSDSKLCSDVRDTLISLLQALVGDNLSGWLALVKDVLQASTDGSNTASTTIISADPGSSNSSSMTASNSASNNSNNVGGLKDEDPEDDDEINIQSINPDPSKRKSVTPKWPTRVFAMECLQKIMTACEDAEVHFDLARAKALVVKGQGDYLVLHLSELVRMAFIAATSDSDKLRLAGLSALQEIISKFCKIPEPEFPGHVILEQYQAQVGAALRPAFTPETAPDVTALACEVCSSWIGSGVARDLNDLRRVHQLLVSSLTKLNDTKDSCLLYSESALTMEKLSVLKSWAEVYIVTMEEDKLQPAKSQHPQKLRPSKEDEDDFGDFAAGGGAVGGGGGESLLSLVQPEIKTLSKHWVAMLKDYALLSLPPDYTNQLPLEGGAFYTYDTMDTSRPHYKKSWPPVVYAVCLWLNQVGFLNADRVWSEENKFAVVTPALQSPSEGKKADVDNNDLGSNNNNNNNNKDVGGDDDDDSEQHLRIHKDRFYLLLGICSEALCNPTSIQTLETVNLCLKALDTLFEDPWASRTLASDQQLSVELLNILHRLLLTRDSTECFCLVISVVRLIIKANRERIENRKRRRTSKVINPKQAATLGAEKSSKQLDDSSTGQSEVERGEAPSEESSSCVVGEGGESGEIEPGKSVVFAALEVSLCVLVRHLPSLNPTILSSNSSSSFSSSLFKQSGFNEQTIQLLSEVVRLLGDLPSLCSPPGCLSVLPTILFLLTGVVKEMAPKGSSGQKISPLVTAVFQSLKSLCVVHPLVGDEKVCRRWNELLQSALLTLLTYAKAEGDQRGIDDATVLLALVIFFVTPPPQVVNHKEIMESSIKIFSDSWSSESFELKQKCMQSLTSIVQRSDATVSHKLIRSLAPSIIDYLLKSEKPLANQTDAILHIEGIKLLESLVALAEDQHRPQLLNVVVPLLISLLNNPATTTTTTTATTASSNNNNHGLGDKIHDAALQKLIDVATQFRGHFQAVMQQHSGLRSRLEFALQNKTAKSLQSAKGVGVEGSSSAAGKAQQQLAQPSIKLKLDFSNFAASN